MAEKIVISVLGSRHNGPYRFGFRREQDVVLDCGHRARVVIESEADRGRARPLSVGDRVRGCQKCVAESFFPTNPIGFAMMGRLGEAFAGLSLEERGGA